MKGVDVSTPFSMMPSGGCRWSWNYICVTEGGKSMRQRVFSVLSLLSVVILITACASSNKAGSASSVGGGPVGSGRAVESLGINIRGLMLSSADYMLYFRYRVVEPAKATPLMDKKIKPYLVVESTGMRLDIPITPKLGMLRQTPRSSSVAKERDYFIMFANPGRRLKSGDKVSLMIGDTKIENLRIE